VSETEGALRLTPAEVAQVSGLVKEDRQPSQALLSAAQKLECNEETTEPS
jgi:hypothetical protein